MPKILRKALLWAIGISGITSLLFEPLSFGIVHHSGMVIFFPCFLALLWQWPLSDSILGWFLYQLAYYAAWGLIISAGIGIYRSREERLKIERERANAS